RLQIQDANGNPVSTPGVTGTAAIATAPAGAGGSLAASTATSDANGVVTFDGLAISGPTGGYTLTFTAPNLAPVTSGTITLAAGDAVQLALVTAPSDTARSGFALARQPVVQLEDGAGNPVGRSGTPVTAAIATGGPALSGANPITTNGGGRAAFTNLTITGAAGPRTLSFSAPQLAAVTSNTVTVIAGAATSIAGNAGNNQTVTAGTAVPIPPSVIVKDASGNPVPGVAVTFAVATGNGSITGASQTTNASGIAAVGSWTLGTAAGQNTLTATSPGVNGSPITFTATATAGAPSAARSLVAAAPGTIAASSGANAATITVTVNDEFGNPVSGATVTLGSTGANNPLPHPAGPTGTNGQVTGTLSSHKAETKTVSATVNGTVAVTATASVTVTPAAAASIAISAGDGQTATVGTAVAVPPGVIVRDAFGNAVAGVAVTFAPGAGGGSITGASQATNASGVAAVTSWTLGSAAGPNTLTATSGTLQGSPVTFRANATAGAATQIAVHAGNGQQARVGTAVAVPPSVIVQDQHGNPVAGVAVTFAPGTGGGSVR